MRDLSRHSVLAFRCMSILFMYVSDKSVHHIRIIYIRHVIEVEVSYHFKLSYWDIRRHTIHFNISSVSQFLWRNLICFVAVLDWHLKSVIFFLPWSQYLFMSGVISTYIAPTFLFHGRINTSLCIYHFTGWTNLILITCLPQLLCVAFSLHLD